MVRGIAVCLVILLLVPGSVGAKSASENPGDVLLVVGEDQLTRADFEDSYAKAQQRHRFSTVPEDIARKLWLERLLKDRLLSLYAEEMIFRTDDLFWKSSVRNQMASFHTNRWLGPKLDGIPDLEKRKAEALRMVGELEEELGVKRFLPMTANGKYPAEEYIVAIVGKEKIPFSRVHAWAAGGYAGFIEWPMGQSEETLRSALDDVIRLEVVGQKAMSRNNGSGPAISSELQKFLLDYRRRIALEKFRYEAFLPDPDMDRIIAEEKAKRPVYFPMVVQVYKGKTMKDMEDLSRELKGYPSGSPGVGRRVENVKQDGKMQYWLKKGVLPKEVEEMAKNIPMDKSFSKVMKAGDEFFLVRIVDRGTPPSGETDEQWIDREKEARGKKFQGLIEKAIRETREKTRVEIRYDLF